MPTGRFRTKTGKRTFPVTVRIDPKLKGRTFNDDPNARQPYQPPIVKRRICR